MSPGLLEYISYKMKNNKALKVLYFYNSLFVFASNLIGPLFAIYVQKFNNQIITISLIWATYIISTAVFSYAFSKFGDRIIEQEYCLMAGFLIRAVVWFTFIFASNIYIVIFLQILLALGEAIGSPAFDAIRSNHVDKDVQMSEFSTWILISNLSMGVATVIGGLTVTFLGFPILFFIMFVLALIAFFGVMSQPRQLL